jgi:hypothetical protein
MRRAFLKKTNTQKHHKLVAHIGHLKFMMMDARERKSPDLKTDVFSFGLILYEILVEQKVFPSTMSTAVMMWKALSDQPRDRPEIPTRLHKVLQ